MAILHARLTAAQRLDFTRNLPASHEGQARFRAIARKPPPKKFDRQREILAAYTSIPADSQESEPERIVMNSIPELRNVRNGQGRIPRPRAFVDRQPGETRPGRAAWGGKQVLDLIANAVQAVNQLADTFRPKPVIQERFYSLKHDLLSVVLEMGIPDVVPFWQRQHNGSHLLIIKIGNRLAPHCPFRRLSWNAQCRIVERIGPVPDSFRAVNRNLPGHRNDCT